LRKIKPREDGKFSRNLYRYVRQFNQRHPSFECKAFRSDEGFIYIGAMFDNEFHGTRLTSILCSGLSKQVYCYLGSSNWRELKRFWTTYARIGVCAIDKKHNVPYDGRFKNTSETRRVCQWCGAEMQLKKWVEKVNRERWEIQPAKKKASGL
jgi:hypothetical protein